MEKTILFVEPDAFFAKTYDAFLRKAGFRVLHTNHGEKVAALAVQEQPDLILLALALPKKDGFEVLEELKQETGAQNIPVIVFSRIGSKDIVDRCYGFGACEYLIKAQNGPEEVVACIRRYLGQS